MELELFQVTLTLGQVFRVSRESYKTQDALIVRLRERGEEGLGEASAFMVSRYGSSIEAMAALLLGLRDELRRYEFSTPEKMWWDFRERFAGNTFAQCALDVAAHDLWSRQRRAPLHAVLGLDSTRSPLSSYSLGIGSVDETLAGFRSHETWPSFKMKVGSPEDIERVRQLRRETGREIRVDANAGWTLDEAIEKAAALAELGVGFIEQPLAADDWASARTLFADSPVPLIADESCTTEDSVGRCVGAFHGVNLKLMKCGGITPALRMIANARSLGLRTMLGCMPESSIGISAVAQLAPLLDYIDVDALEFITNDPATGVRIEDGHIRYPDASGTGARLRATSTTHMTRIA